MFKNLALILPRFRFAT